MYCIKRPLMLVCALLLSMADKVLPALALFLSFSSWVLPTALAFPTISRLPGFDGPLPFHLETGYLAVDESNETQLFDYFIKSERNPADDPLLLWLTGGPGCSALSGLAFEIGRLKFKIEEYNGSMPTLLLNPYSWTKTSNIIFLDSPVGTGFSFSKKPGDYVLGDARSVGDIYTFLKKWFIDHLDFSSSPFYVAGDSYAGKIVPLVAQTISKGSTGHEPLINLKGYLIGNPSTGEKCDKMSIFPHARDLWIIPDEFYKMSMITCEGQTYDNPATANCAEAVEKLDDALSQIDKAHVLEPACLDDTYMVTSKAKSTRRSLEAYYTCTATSPRAPPLQCKSYAYYLCYQWANMGITREALHVQKATIGEWKRCNIDLSYVQDIPSSIPYQLDLINEGYKVLVYSGDHDLVVPIVGTKEWITSLNLSITGNWRPWWVDEQVAGYTLTFSKDLTFASVKGGGHTAPEYKPKECFAMFQRWISDNSL